MTLVLALVAFGVFAGVVSGLVGVGGGVFIVPFLVIVVGMSQHTAQATSMLVVLPTAIAATSLLARTEVGDNRLGYRMGMLGAASSVAGAYLALMLPGPWLRGLFSVLMAIVGTRLLWDAWRTRPPSGA